MGFSFTKATKKQAKARFAFIGPSGSGKTTTGLILATKLLTICKPGARIRVIDSERGSAAKYSDLFDFDVCELDGDFSPRAYREAIAAAVADGMCGVVLIDSLSHAWNGKGGALEMVDKAQARSKSANSFTAWREVTPEHNELVDALIQCPAHLGVTMRAKTEYVLQEDDRGKKVPKKIGMAPIQRDGLEYEFDLVGDMDNERNTFTESKTRCPKMKGSVLREPTGDSFAPFVAWLSDGAPAEEKPAPAPKPAASKAAAPSKSAAAQQQQPAEVHATEEQAATFAALKERISRGFRAVEHRKNWIEKPENKAAFQSLPAAMQDHLREAFKKAPIGPEHGKDDAPAQPEQPAANTDGTAPASETKAA